MICDIVSVSYLDLVFDSKEQALKATDELKGFSSGLNILNAADVDEWKKKDFDGWYFHGCCL